MTRDILTAVVYGLGSPSCMRSAWLQVLRSCIMMFSRLTYTLDVQLSVLNSVSEFGDH
jgi:hypothetical protein